MKLFETLRFHKKTQDQFMQLILPHVIALYQSAFKLTGSQSDAEDLIQDLLTKLYPKVKEIQAVKELRPWLYRVLYNQFIDHCRKQSRNPASDSNREQLADYEMIGILASSNPQPEELAEKTQRSNDILNVLASLNHERRALVTLHLIDGFTLEELTNVFNVPLGTLKSRLHRTKAYLKTQLQLDPFHAIERGKGKKVTK